MTPNITAIPVGSKLLDASKVMHERGYSQLPVLGPRGTVVGSITDKLFTNLILNDVKDWQSKPVDDFMGEPFPVVAKNISMRAVARLLEERDAVLVKDQEEYIGIVTRDNLLTEIE